MDGAERIGFIGLGTMGAPMCRRLVEAGYRVVAFDIDRAALAALGERGAEAAASATECAGSSTILLTSLPHPHHVQAVMEGPDGALAAMRPGTMWVDLTTNERALLERLGTEAPDGVTVCDAPVTGAVDGARSGQLTLFLGGAAQGRARATTVLEHLGLVIQCGDLGSGNVVKLVTNQLWFIHAAALGEGFALGMANGVELGTLWEAIKASVADSFVARHDAPSIFAGHYDPSFTLDLCLKDLGLIERLAGEVGTDLPMTAAAGRVFSDAADRYGRHAGELHVARRIEDDAGLEMRLEGAWVPPWES